MRGARSDIVDTSHSRTTRALPFVAAAVAILFGVLLLDMGRLSSAVSREATQYHVESEQLGLLLLHLKELEANQRGYIITGDESYLEQYRASVDAVQTDVRRLAWISRAPTEASSFARLSDLAARRIAISAQTVALRESSGLNAAADLVGRGTGQAVMNDISRLIGEMTGRIEELRRQRTEDVDRRARAMLWIIGFGAIASAVTAFASNAVLSRIARRNAEDARQLRVANEQLREQAVELEAQAAELEVQAQELFEAGAEGREREEWFRSVLEHATDAILVADERGIVTYASTSLQSILQRSPAEFIGHRLLDQIHPDDCRSALRALGRATRNGAGATEADIRIRHANGSWRVMSGHIRDLLHHPGVNGLVLNGHDVTDERHNAEQLRQSQKMEAIGQLAGGVAHDFNNLLTTIRGFTQFVIDSLGAGHESRSDLEAVLRASDAATSLTRQLLAFSRQQVLRPEVTDLNAVVTESGALISRLIGTDVELVTHLEPELWRVRVDRGQMMQVILNLAVNARDAMPAGGRLTIETANVALTDGYVSRHHDVPTGDYVVLTISDNGQGIPADIRDRMFDPFFTTKAKGKGTGLGLSTSQGIVKQSKGHIWVYSEIGRGTTFRIYLPATTASLDVPPEVKVAATATPRGRTVLFVEDDPGVRSFSIRALKGHGYHVIACTDALAALDALREHGGEIDIVITDVIMPGMSGAELGRRVEKLYPGTPMLYTSGYPSGEIEARGNIPPNVDFLEKPYTSADLTSRIAAAIGRVQ